MTNQDYKYYDVLNDYSLELSEDNPVDILYNWRESKTGEFEIGTHKKHKEVHYVRTTSGRDFSGRRI